MPESRQAVSPPAVGAILTWFSANKRDFPWRSPDCTPWGVLVSEVMSQQTPMARVLPVWQEWMTRWPTPAALASASSADAVRAWGRLGYPRRAQRLWECARTIVDDHDGQVPHTEEQLRALPGIGEYTAAAVAAFGFGERTVVLDTNVRRVIGRIWRAEALPPAHLTRVEHALAANLVPSGPARAVEWSAAAMELGALVCVARGPRCESCPVREHCAWFAAGKPGLEQAPRRTQAWHGTDRQVRGKVLAIVREAPGPVSIVDHPYLDGVDAEQVDRCVASLVSDGLIATGHGPPGTYTL